MALYFDGYSEARASLQAMTTEQLLDWMEGMKGTDGIEDKSDHEEVLNEALRQCKEDFTDRSSTEYSRLQFHIGASKVFARQSRY